MATLITRELTGTSATPKNASLTYAEMDTNLINLNNELMGKANTSSLGTAATTAATDYTPASHVGSSASAHAVATTSVAGFLSASDKTKLDGVASGATANTGTVTSVSLSAPSDLFSITNSPVTTSGTLTLSKVSKTAKYVFAAPNAADGDPVFRALVASDIPTLNQNTTGTAANVTGTVAILNGGTGATIAATALSNLGGEPADANIAKVNSAKTWSATQTFNGIEINDTSNDHQYILGVSELTADRTVTLPLLTGNDTFVFASHSQTLTNKTVTGLKETKVASSGNAFDLTLGNYFTHTIASTAALSVSNVPATGTVGSFIIELTNGGAYVFSFWTGTTGISIKWAGGVVPTFTTSGVDILGFYTHDGGTTWRGLLLAKDSK